MDVEQTRSIARRRWQIGCVALGIAAVAACSSVPVDTVSLQMFDARSDILFLARSEASTMEMEALFKGRVTADDAGCLRLDTDDRHTVIWPHGFTVELHDGRAVVVSVDGRQIGAVGGQFEFGGGEVPTLHEGISLTAADRAAALSACPGRYWIVGKA